MDVETPPLSSLVAELAGRQLDDVAQIEVVDVDGDSILDLVVLLSFEASLDQGKSWLALLRRRGSLLLSDSSSARQQKWFGRPSQHFFFASTKLICFAGTI